MFYIWCMNNVNTERHIPGMCSYRIGMHVLFIFCCCFCCVCCPRWTLLDINAVRPMRIGWARLIQCLFLFHILTARRFNNRDWLCRQNTRFERQHVSEVTADLLGICWTLRFKHIFGSISTHPGESLTSACHNWRLRWGLRSKFGRRGYINGLILVVLLPIHFILYSLTFSCLLRYNSVLAEDRRSEQFVGQRKLKS